MTGAGLVGVVWVLCAAAAAIGFMVGRRFRDEELGSIRLENIHLRGSLEKELLRCRLAEKTCLELRAALQHRAILRAAMRREPVTELAPVDEAAA